MADALTLHAFDPEWQIETESCNDIRERELLLDRVMGYERFLKSSENLRRGRSPSDFLALAARSACGDIVGTVRLWDVCAGGVDALLLGPLAVSPEWSGRGIGSALMDEAVSRAASLGHGAVVLVGDPGYYARFGFASLATRRLDMPGHFERHRLAPPENHIWFIGRFQQGDNGEAQVVVHEALPIEILLSEHARIPAPSFDSDGDPIEKHFDTWSDLHWEGHRGKPSWDKFVKVTRSIPGLDAMFEEGFHLTMTGGGCTAFELFDEETETLWLASSEASVDAHPLSLEWIVGRYRNVENGGDECISVSNTTIPEIIARYRDIPVPQEGQEEFYWNFGSWDKLDAHLYEAGQAARPA